MLALGISGDEGIRDFRQAFFQANIRSHENLRARKWLKVAIRSAIDCWWSRRDKAIPGHHRPVIARGQPQRNRRLGGMVTTHPGKGPRRPCWITIILSRTNRRRQITPTIFGAERAEP